MDIVKIRAEPSAAAGKIGVLTERLILVDVDSNVDSIQSDLTSLDVFRKEAGYETH